MKRLLLACLLCAAVLHTQAQACCCTGAGANYSILPNLNKQVVGLHYTFRSFDTRMVSLNPELNGMEQREYMHALELYGRFNLHARWQMSFFLPLNYIEQRSALATHRSLGMGDITVLTQFALLDPLKCHGKPVKHQVRIGAGIKFPTGKFNRQADDSYYTGVQSGTGSFDFPFNAIYTFRYNNWGLNATAGYRLNTPNRFTFKFGDRISADVTALYVIKAGNFNLMPSVGIQYEHVFENSNHGQQVYLSHCEILRASASIDFYSDRFTISLKTTPVVYQQIPVRMMHERIAAEAGFYYQF